MTEPAQEFIKLISVADTAMAVTRDPDGATRVSIDGHLLNGNRAEFKQLVVDQIEKGDKTVVLDLLRCGYIDSAGLGAVVSVSRKVDAAGGQLRIEGLNEDLVTLFALTKLDTFLTIVPPLKKAAGAVQTSANPEAAP